MTSFSPIGTRKIDDGAKFSEIKVQKTLVMFVRDRNLARYLEKTYCVRKCKKMDTAISNNVVGSKHKARRQDCKVMWDFFFRNDFLDYRMNRRYFTFLLGKSCKIGIKLTYVYVCTWSP